MRLSLCIAITNASALAVCVLLMGPGCSSGTPAEPGNDGGGMSSGSGSGSGSSSGSGGTSSSSGASSSGGGMGASTSSSSGGSGSSGASSSSGGSSSSGSSSSSGGSSGADGGGADGSSKDGSAADVVVADAALTDAGTLVRTGWTAVAMPDHVPANMTNPQTNESLVTSNAFDGNRMTRWATGVFQSTLTFPLYFTVNMNAVSTVSKITLYAGTPDPNDYPYMMDVLFSTDGTNFTPVVTGHAPAPPTTGANLGIDTIMIPAGTAPTQYIQLKATAARTPANSGGNNYWWAIGEMNVYP